MHKEGACVCEDFFGVNVIIVTIVPTYGLRLLDILTNKKDANSLT